MSEPLKQPRLFRVNDEGLKEVVPGALYMKHINGADMGVALFKFMKGKGSDAPADVHSHGEEVGIVLKGTARVHGTDGTEYVLNVGDAIIIPKGWEHSGSFDDNEECLIFTVAYPVRPDYGDEDDTPAPAGFDVADAGKPKTK